MTNEMETSALAVDLSGVAAEVSVVTQDIERAFQEVGETISTELARAARSGEADFKAMAQAIVAELAQLALNRALGGESSLSGFDRVGGQAATVNVNMPVNGQSGASGNASGVSSAQLAQIVAQAVRLGSRYL